MDCAGDEYCAAGVCADACTDRCPVADQIECSGWEIRICEQEGEFDCNNWSLPTPCPEDNHHCVPTADDTGDAACVLDCPEPCADSELDSTRCSEGNVQRCEQIEEFDCNNWNLLEPCRDAEHCAVLSATGVAACFANCPNLCTNAQAASGATQCIGRNIQRCEFVDEFECNNWSTPEACIEDDHHCETLDGVGTCVPNCPGECDPLDYPQCNSGTEPPSHVTCEMDGLTGCYATSPPLGCSFGQDCGETCGPDPCYDPCPTPHDVICDTMEGWRECLPPTGADCGSRWSEAADCGPDQLCSGGICYDSCDETNLCSASGDTRCGPYNSVEICDGPAFSCDVPTWRFDEQCDHEEACINGRCEVDCPEDCHPVGSSYCFDNVSETCEFIEELGCHSLVYQDCDSLPCDNATGMCSDSCDPCDSEVDSEPECRTDAGELIVVECTLVTGQECWATVEQCHPTATCAAGECIGPCSDACIPDETTTVCLDTDRPAICFPGEGAGECATWHDEPTCAPDEVCRGGACEPLCRGDGVFDCSTDDSTCLDDYALQCVMDEEETCSGMAGPILCIDGDVCRSGMCTEY